MTLYIKTIFSSVFIVLTSILTLSGCAAPTSDLVPAGLPQDDSLTCAQLVEQKNTNNTQIDQLDPQHKLAPQPVKEQGRVSVSVSPWIYVHFSDANEAKVKALQRRNQHLQDLAASKHCNNKP